MTVPAFSYALAAGKTTSARLRRFGEEHVLHDDETSSESAAGSSRRRPTGFARLRTALSILPAFAASIISGKAQTAVLRNVRPTPHANRAGVGNGLIAGQQIGIDAHVRCAARVGIVARGRSTSLRACDEANFTSDAMSSAAHFRSKR